MNAQGRTCPFNGIKMSGFRTFEANCPFELAENGRNYEHLSTTLRLQHLEIGLTIYNPLCPAHQQLLTWLGRQKNENRTLRTLSFCGIKSTGIFQHLFQPENQSPTFPQLEKIVILGFWEALCRAEDESVFAQIFQNAPNLKRIDVLEPQALELVPRDKYKLIHNLTELQEIAN